MVSSLRPKRFAWASKWRIGNKGISKKKSKAKATKKSKTLGKSKKRHYGSNRQYSKRGGKTVRYTKTGQPFIILKSGKARFIKKSGVR